MALSTDVIQEQPEDVGFFAEMYGEQEVPQDPNASFYDELYPTTPTTPESTEVSFADEMFPDEPILTQGPIAEADKTFLGNVRWGAVFEESMIANAMKFVMTSGEQLENNKVTEEKRVRDMGDNISGVANFYIQEEQLADALEAGQISEDEFWQMKGELWELMDAASTEYAKAKVNSPDFTIQDMVEAVTENPQIALAEMANIMLTDPYLMLTPLGWNRTAAGTAHVAYNLGLTGKATQVSARIVGGSIGTAAIAGTMGFSIRAAEGLGDTGEVDYDAAIDQAQIDALFGLGMTAVFKGISGGLKGVRNARFENQVNQIIDEADLDVFTTNDMSRGVKLELSDNVKSSQARYPNPEELYIDAKGNTVLMSPESMKNHLADMERLTELRSTADIGYLNRKDFKDVNVQQRGLENELRKYNKRVAELEATVAKFSDNPKKHASAAGNLRNFQETKGVELGEKLSNIDKVLSTHEAAKAARKDLLTEGLAPYEAADTIQIGNKVLTKLNPAKGFTEQGVVLKYVPGENTGNSGNHTNSWDPYVKATFDEPLPVIPKKSLAKQLGGKIKRVAHEITGKAPNLLKNITDDSTTAAWLRNKMVKDPFETRVGKGHTITEEIQFQHGQFLTKMEDAQKLLVQKLGRKMSKEDNLELSASVRGVQDAIDPDIQEAAVTIRKHMVDMAEYARKGNVVVNTAGGKGEVFFPHNYSTTLKDDEIGLAFQQTLLKSDKRNRTPLQAQQAHRKITEGFGMIGDAFYTKGQAFNAKSFNSRSVEVPDSELMPYLNHDDIFGQVKDYTLTTVSRTELARIFGDAGPRGKDGVIAKIEKELMESRGEVDDVAIQRIDDLYNAMNGMHGQVNTPLLATINNASVTFQTLSKLPLAALTSITEPLLAVSRTGPKAALFGLAQMSYIAGKNQAAKVFSKIPEDIAFREAKELGLIHDKALGDMIQNITGGGGEGKIATTITNQFFRKTALHAVTEYSRLGGYLSGKQMILQDIQKLSKDFGDDGAVARLQELGIEPADGVAWLKNGSKVSEPFYMEVKRGAQSVANDVVMNPDSLNKPIWQSNHKLKMFAHLKSYSAAFTNTVLDRAFEGFRKLPPEAQTRHALNNAMAAALIVGTQMAVVAPVKDLLRNLWGTTPDRKSDEDRIKAGLASSGYMGPLTYVMDMYNASEYNRHPLIAAAGPSVGLMFDATEAGFKAAAGNKNVVPRVISQQAPIVNINRSTREWLYRQLGGGLGFDQEVIEEEVIEQERLTEFTEAATQVPTSQGLSERGSKPQRSTKPQEAPKGRTERRESKPAASTPKARKATSVALEAPKTVQQQARKIAGTFEAQDLLKKPTIKF